MRTILVSAAVAMVLALFGTPLAIRMLSRRGYGQEIREDGPSTHLTKRGTPTMGGTVIVLSTLFAYFVTKLATGKWPTDSALLVLFLRHPGEVLSRTRIYEHVWDERYDGLSNTLEVHIMELRRKLEKHGPRLIHTLRGRGYMFGHDDA